MRADLEFLDEAGKDGFDGGVEEAVLFRQFGQASAGVEVDVLDVVGLVFVPEGPVEILAHTPAAPLDDGVMGLPDRLALVLGRLTRLRGEPGLVAVEALLHGEGLAQVAAGDAE